MDCLDPRDFRSAKVTIAAIGGRDEVTARSKCRGRDRSVATGIEWNVAGKNSGYWYYALKADVLEGHAASWGKAGCAGIRNGGSERKRLARNDRAHVRNARS